MLGRISYRPELGGLVLQIVVQSIHRRPVRPGMEVPEDVDRDVHGLVAGMLLHVS